MIQIFTKQKYVRRIGSGGAFGVMMWGGRGGWLISWTKRAVLSPWTSSDQ